MHRHQGDFFTSGEGNRGLLPGEIANDACRAPGNQACRKDQNAVAIPESVFEYLDILPGLGTMFVDRDKQFFQRLYLRDKVVAHGSEFVTTLSQHIKKSQTIRASQRMISDQNKGTFGGNMLQANRIRLNMKVPEGGPGKFSPPEMAMQGKKFVHFFLMDQVGDLTKNPAGHPAVQAGILVRKGLGHINPHRLRRHRGGAAPSMHRPLGRFPSKLLRFHDLGWRGQSNRRPDPYGFLANRAL